jgi:serine/threonine-protein kinase
LDRPAPRASAPTLPAPGTSRIATNTSVHSEEAITAIELQRTRELLKGIAGSALLTAVIVFVLPGDPLATKIHASALLAAAATAALCAWKFSRLRASIVAYGQIVVLLTGFHFWGLFSAYCALVPLTLYIIAGVATTREAWGGTALLVVAQVTFGLLTIFEIIPSRGLVEPVRDFVPVWGQLVALGLLQVICIGAMAAGRDARSRSTQVLEEHNQALLELARREALLAEANAEARAAREAGQGGAGRFSEQTIDGFRLGNVLGRGAMGEVYAAERDGDPPLAMKLLAPHLLGNADARERFLRESAIVSKIRSAHICHVVAVAPPDALLPYIVMERLDGQDLGQLLKKTPVFPAAEVEKVITQIAAGLDAAHRAGVIHRDLKPSNIFAIGAGEGRTWKLLDFGASKWRDGDGTLTHGQIVGTPTYMAPEQAQGHVIDSRSDVYALGVVLYRLVTGVPAVVGADIPQMLQEVVYRVPVQPSKRAAVSAPVEAVLAIALAKSPVHRFATAGELASALSAALVGTLDRALAKRAAALLHDAPWGRRIKA